MRLIFLIEICQHFTYNNNNYYYCYYFYSTEFCLIFGFYICVQSRLIIYSLIVTVVFNVDSCVLVYLFVCASISISMCLCNNWKKMKCLSLANRSNTSVSLCMFCVWERVGTWLCVDLCTGTYPSVGRPKGLPGLLSLLMMIDAGGPHTPWLPS